MAELPLILVTGASGFIGSHVISELLAEKKYRVRGTVRSLAKESVIQPIKDTFPELELVEADLSKDDGWKEAVAGCTFVHHIASPFPQQRPKNREEIVRPAVDGTKRVLQACVDAGTVKRVVLTSSIAAVSTGLMGNVGLPADHVYSSEEWTNADLPRCPPYEASKTYAEKAAWDFVKDLEDGKKFELVTILPATVFGPLIFAKPASSHGLLSFLLKRQVSAVPDLHIPSIDVRDVSKAHMAAMTNDIAPGNRYIVWQSTAPLREVAKVLAKEFNPQGYNVPVGNLPKFVVWFSKLFSGEAKTLYPLIGCSTQFDITKLKEELGIEPMGIEESFIECCYSMIEKEIIPKKPGYKGRQGERAGEGAGEAKEQAASDQSAKPEETKPEETAEPEEAEKTEE